MNYLHFFVVFRFYRPCALRRGVFFFTQKCLPKCVCVLFYEESLVYTFFTRWIVVSVPSSSSINIYIYILIVHRIIPREVRQLYYNNNLAAA